MTRLAGTTQNKTGIIPLTRDYPIVHHGDPGWTARSPYILRNEEPEMRGKITWEIPD
jgi:hypothetical protein